MTKEKRFKSWIGKDISKNKIIPLSENIELVERENDVGMTEMFLKTKVKETLKNIKEELKSKLTIAKFTNMEVPVWNDKKDEIIDKTFLKHVGCSIL